LSESPLKFGLLYAGTDDGNVLVSKDAGGSWNPIHEGLPVNKWISSITASPLDEATVFVSLNGYREDDFATLIYMSIDYGKTWRNIKGDLPDASANVIIQDPVNADLLYCGLDNGTYVSFDKGATWNFFTPMLNVPSYDMIVHPRDNELVVGTHGRSVFVADVKPLQALKDGGHKKAVIAYAPENIRHSERWGEKQFPWSKVNEAKAIVLYYVGKASADLTVEIYNEKNDLVRKLNTSGTTGFHSLSWDVKLQEASQKKTKGKPAEPSGELKYAAKGKYKFKFLNGTESSDVTLEIK
jgi:photosystem II stability/assembly factor-like uncharacterized protein